MNWLLAHADPNLDWGYAMTTLLIRFIGVFIVMLVMQVFLQVSARAVAWIENREAGRKPASRAEPLLEGPLSVDGLSDNGPAAGGVPPQVAAAIGLALQLEARAHRPRRPPAPPSSSWALAGRMAQLHRTPR